MSVQFLSAPQNHMVTENVQVREHVMIAKFQLKKQKQQFNYAPEKILLEDVLLPRNRKQVSNSILREREKMLIPSDDIIGIYILNAELDYFFKSFISCQIFR